MKVVDGILVVQKVFPVTALGLDPTTGELAKRLHDLAMENPDGRDNIIRAMDRLGLAVRGSYICLSR